MTNDDEDNSGRPWNNSYAVGYRKPPVEHRFKPGCSGNPKGRPKGRKNAAATIHRLMNERISVRVGNKTIVMPVFDAMFYGLRNQALKGDPKAIREMIAITTQHDYEINPPENCMTVKFVSSGTTKKP